MVSFTDHYNAISIDRLSSKTKIGKDSLKQFFYVSPSSPQLKRILFLLEIQKATTLQQVTGGNTTNIVLKGMQRYFLTTPPLKI